MHPGFPTFCSLVLLLLAGVCSADIAAPGEFAIEQPDGTTFTARKGGDEWFHWVESGGYLIAKESDGFWYYLERQADTVVPSFERVGIDAAPQEAAMRSDLALLRAQQSAGAPSSPLAAGGLPSAAAPPSGPEPLLVIAVEFSDRSLTYADTTWSTEIFGAVGKTVRNYYLEASQGSFNFNPAAETQGTAGDGVIRVTLGTPHPNPAMTGDANRQITKDALIAANPFINYAAFDANSNGSLSVNELHVLIIVAGWEEAFYSAMNPNIWAHRWQLGWSVPVPTLDGVAVGGGGYTQIGEIQADHPATIGVICHELGHDIGLPDLYDTDSSSEGVGSHCVMGSGSWGYVRGEESGTTPVLPCAWSRQRAGFLTPTSIFVTGTYSAREASDVSTGNSFRINPPSAPATEYFLIENRELTGFDAGFDGVFWSSGGAGGYAGGLQIWHIDDAQSSNSNENRKWVDLEEANQGMVGASQLDTRVNRGSRRHLYYSGHVTAWNDGTTPNAMLYSGVPSGISVSNVSANGASMTFDVGGTGLPGPPVPACNITAPSAGAMVTGSVSISFSASDTDNLPLTSTFAYSTNGGGSWQLATTAAGSMLANPDAGRATPFSVTYLWDSAADAIGLSGNQAATLRITVDNLLQARTCTVAVTVNNQVNCSISAPTAAQAVSGAVVLTFSATNPAGAPVTSTMEFSTNAGASWSACSAAPGSPLANPDPARAVPTGPVTFRWHSQADGVGLVGAQVASLRVTVTDGVGAPRTCSVGSLSVGNVPGCAITSPGAGAGVSGAVRIRWNGSDPSGDLLTSTIAFSSNGGATWIAATAAAGSPTSNPDSLRATPFTGVNFDWNSQLDGAGAGGLQMVTVRVTVTDGFAQNSSTVSLNVTNQPSCNITLPSTGATTTGNVRLRFGGLDPSNDSLTSTFDYSSDGGASWALCTAAAVSALANPDPSRPSPFVGVNFDWDSEADGLGYAGPQAVRLRVTVDDGVGTGTSTRDINVDNHPECSIALPTPGSMRSGDVTVSFGANHPGGLPVTSTFEWSTDFGATFAMAAVSPSSATANPDPMRPSGFLGQLFAWDTRADLVGFAGQAVEFRITVDDGFTTSSCSVNFTVDNPLPTCMLSVPAGTVRGDLAFDVSTDSTAAITVNILLEVSDDGGVTFRPCTMAAASPTANPATRVPEGVRSFVWDSRADAVAMSGPAAGVILRASVTDPVTPVPGTCTEIIEVDNGMLCVDCGDCNTSGAGPDILDALRAAQIAAGSASATATQTACCDVNSSSSVDIIDALRMAQAAAGLGVTLNCQ